MGTAIEADHSDAMRDVAENGIEHRRDGSVVVEVRCAQASGLRENEQGNGLGVVVGLHAESLHNSVVGKQEIVGGELEDDFAVLGFHQGRDEDQVGADG